MKSIEVSAKTREEAIEKALREMKVERHQIEVEIVDEGSKGFLGLGRRDVKIRVSADVPGDDRGGRDRKRSDRDRGDRGDRPARGNRDRDRGRREARESRPARDEAPRDSDRSDRGSRSERGERSGRRGPASRPERSERDERPARPERPERKRPEPRERAPRAEDRGRKERSAPPMDPAELEARGTEAAALLHTLITHMGIENTVTSHVVENRAIRLNIRSEDSAILIGRKGQTLRSLQYLINRMIHEGDVETGERILVDVEGYVDRRTEKLEELAQRMAERAKETRRRIRLKPLNAQERRVIHLTLQDDPDVETFSVGKADLRSVVIAPKDELPRSDDDRDSGSRGRGGRDSNRDRSSRRERPAFASTQVREGNGESAVLEEALDGDPYAEEHETVSAPAPVAEHGSSGRTAVAAPELAEDEHTEHEHARVEAPGANQPVEHEPESDSSGAGRRRKRGGFRGRQAFKSDGDA